MALPIRPNNGIPPKAKPAAVRSPRLPKPAAEEDFSLPSFDELAQPPAPARGLPVRKPRPVPKTPKPEIKLERETEEGWAIDEKTGVKYKTIPKSVYEGKGKNARPKLAIEDFDVDNMTDEAETYLGHLRVPPDKEEQERLKQLRIQLRKRSDASYVEANKEELAKDEQETEAVIPEKRKTEQPKQSLIQKLAGLFR